MQQQEVPDDIILGSQEYDLVGGDVGEASGLFGAVMEIENQEEAQSAPMKKKRRSGPRGPYKKRKDKQQKVAHRGRGRGRRGKTNFDTFEAISGEE